MGRTASAGGVLLGMVFLMVGAQLVSDRWYGMYVREYEAAVHRQGMVPPVGIAEYAQVPLHDRGFTVFPDVIRWRG